MNAAAGLERHGTLLAVGDAHAVAGAITQGGADLLPEPGEIDHHVRARRPWPAPRGDRRSAACRRPATSGFGSVSVSGRSRSPRPAASTMALRACGPVTPVRRLPGDALVGARQLGSDPALEKLGEPRKLRIQPAGLAHVVERQRQIAQVARLAVPVPEAREDAEHLDVPLHADEIEPAQELRAALLPARVRRATAAASDSRAPSSSTRSRGQRDVTILQQRDEVVADRPAQRVLEVDDAGIALADAPSDCASDSRDARTPPAAPAPRRSGTRRPRRSSRARRRTARARDAGRGTTPA